MAIFIDHDIVRFEVSKNDVTFMQALNCQQDFSRVDFGSRFYKFAFQLQNLTQIATRTVLKDQVQLVACLKGVVQIDDEGMLYVGQHIAFGLGVLH